MLKRCLLAVTVALLVTSSQIAAAEDWSSVRNFNSKAELARWIEAGRRQGQTEFNFTISNMTITKEEMSNRISVDAGGRLAFPDAENNYYTYYVNELPGTRVANAYLSRNQQQAWMNLSDEEKELYNIAVAIVQEANRRSSQEARERYIHDEICRRVNPMSFDEYRYYLDENGDYVKDEYGNKKIKPFATAIGALINGKGNCSAYSDTFYMLCRMLNMNVVRVGGMHIGGSEHGWNAIKLDGKVYFVDVMWDDQSWNDPIRNHRHFNASEQIMMIDHMWDYDFYTNL